MRVKRFWRHALMHPMKARRCFPASTLQAIGREISAQENRHRGEICFVVEAELGSRHLWHEVSPRQRAKEVFALQGVWNTEENNGVLIYVLLADRQVEIVADRGIDKFVSQAEWHHICHLVEGHFRAGRFEEGSIAGVRAVSDLLARHFPPQGPRRHELDDRPLVI